MRKVAFEGGPLDGQTRMCRSHDTTKRVVVCEHGSFHWIFGDEASLVYERGPFVGGEVPWPIPYRYVERRDPT